MLKFRLASVLGLFISVNKYIDNFRGCDFNEKKNSMQCDKKYFDQSSMNK